MSSSIPVLIIGAGPTGLLLACELARRNISFRIIDKKPERTLTANAIGIQTRTLELLDNLGLIHHFLRLGHECTAIQFHESGRSKARITFESLDSTYHFILTLPQSETERLLNEHLMELRGEVERPLELIALTQDAKGLECTLLSLETNQSETVRAQWLVACDGANSKVRELCQIPFPGQDLSEQFMVANSEMSSFLSNKEIHLFLNPGSLLAAIPFGSHAYRVGVNLHQTPRKFIIEKEVKELIQERSHGDYDVNSVSWISPFWIHSKIVKKLRYGPIFLAGDAAHIHSPAGAQGMNTGMQDAYNLAWKLALVIQGRAKEELLDSYQEERYPLVSQIVKRAERFTKMVLYENLFLRTLRNLLFKIVSSHPRLSTKFSMRLTQLSLSYTKSSIIDYHHPLSRQSPRPGERVPDVYITHANRLHTHLREPRHKVLLFTGLKAGEKELEKIKTLQQWLQARYPETIQVIIISEKKRAGFDPLLLDERKTIHKRFHIHSSALYVIRPDNYISHCSQNFDPSHLQKVLETYLT